MNRRYKFIFALLMVALLLSGCMKTVDQMYRLPKRSQEFTELQQAIDEVMEEMSFSAPESGDHRQAVQMADLNADGTEEYLVFAEGDTESPLRVLIFALQEDGYILAQSITCSGISFDMVEYAHMDAQAGVELVIGSQLSQNLQCNVEVYTFSETLQPEQMLSGSYADCLIVDMDEDGYSELVLLRGAGAEADNGAVQLYSARSGTMTSSNESVLSGPVHNLRRVTYGNIEGNVPAVYAATSVDDGSLITDVYILKSGNLCNITLSSEYGTSIRTLRNDYLYAADMDNDGVMELPYLLPMMPMDHMVSSGKQELIRWYAMTSDGEEVAKVYTFHNFADGWYLKLDPAWAQRLTVVENSTGYDFHIWDENFESSWKVFTIRDSGEKISEENPQQILLYESTDSVLTAQLTAAASSFEITPDTLPDLFHRIH